MPTQEAVDTFFIDFSNEMKKQGLFIMDDIKDVWPDLPTIDEVRDAARIENESSSEDDQDD